MPSSKVVLAARHTQLSLLLALAVGATAVLPPQAAADFRGISYYTHSSSACGHGDRIKDPIIVVLAGSNATADNTSNLFDRVVGWGTQHTVDPSPQWIINHGTCQKQEHQQKKGTRRGHHCRLWESFDFDNKHRHDTVCDAHEEFGSFRGNCGLQDKPPYFASDVTFGRLDRYASGFDAGAREVYGQLHNNPSYKFLGIFYRPSKQMFQQCDGSVVGWDGRQLFFQLDTQVP